MGEVKDNDSIIQIKFGENTVSGRQEMASELVLGPVQLESFHMKQELMYIFLLFPARSVMNF